MAKDSKKDIKNRIKKATPQANEWLVNVTKSFGFASLDVVKDLIPNTYSTVDWNKDVVINTADMIKDIRKNNGIRNAFNKQFQNLPQLQVVKDIKNNILEDIKSGKLYNQNRALGLNDDGEFNFDDFSFDDGDGPIFIDDDGSGSDTSGESPDNSGGGGGRTPVTVINTMPLAKTISASTEATVSTMVGIAEQNMAIETEKMMMSKQTFEASLNALNSMNENLALLVQFNADSTAKYHAAALQFFEESIKAIKKPEEEDKKNKIKKVLNPFTAEGGLKLDEYAEIIKQNLTDIKDENMLLSTAYDFLKDPEMLKELGKNPLGFLMTEGIKKMIPKTFKSSLGKLDKNVNAIMPALLARINTFGDSDDPLLKMLNKVFGTHDKINYDVDLGNYEKGAISWDGESKKALVEVIPSYLRRIESVLAGTEERFYNYSTGKFDNIQNIKKHYDDEAARVETSGFFGVKSEINDVVSKLDLSSDARKQFDKDLVEYFRAMTKKGHLIRHEDKTNEIGFTTNEMTEAGLFDYDLNRTKLMQRVLSMLPKHVLTEMGTVAITDSISKSQKHYDSIRENPSLSGYSYLYNDLDENGVARYNKSKLTNISEKDRYGLNHLDYLRDIRSALINGIRVFPDHRRRFANGVPNAGILNREREENEEYEARMQKEREEAEANNIRNFSRGRSINDAANMRDSEWNRTFPQEINIDPNRVEATMDTLNNKVENMIYEILYGEDDYKEKGLENLKKIYGKSKPIVLSMRGFFSDTVKAFKSFFTGQGYVTSDGVKVEPTESLIGSIKTSLFGIKDKFVDSTKPGGMFYKFFDDFMDGFDTFKTSLFGEKKLSDGKETFQDLMGKIKQRLPKALAYGYGGAVIKTMFASNLGLLGNFLLPGGPIGAMLTGTTIGFLKQSETFNRYMFGEQDEDGNRTGGLISKAWQDKYQEYKGVIGKGAGLGILASLFLPGGPVAGAILGIGTGIASRNEAFQEFLYGKDYKEQDKKSIMNGAFGKALKKLSGGGETDDPKLAKFLGATGLGVGIAQGVGLLPSFLLPGGPIMGAMLGLAGGIAASSNKFQEFLLGEKDIDGQRHGGLLTKAANWFSLTFAQPLKLKFTEFNDFLYGMLRKNIFDPIARSFEPIVHGVKNVFINAKDSLVEAFTNITHPIVKAFKESIIDPISTVVKKAILNPIKWILKKSFGLMTKTLVGIITSPISIAGRVADKYNEYSAVRQEKFRRRREYDKNTAKEDRNYYDRKAAGKLTKEEKKEAIAKGVSYRKGKTWGEKKKEQKDAYNEEMAKRKDRRKQMQEQFEEDKKFAKENGFKYRSKKQQEKREQELKEKERWIQEQQLMQAQETDEKVSKIADNVIQFPQQNDKVVNRLDEVKETLKEGFNKLANKMGFGDDGEYGQVTDEHLAPIYDFLDEKQKRRPESVTKEPEDYGQVTDEHLATIHNFIDKENAKEEKPATLKDAFDGFKSEVKDLFKTIKDVRDNKNSAPGLPDPNRERKFITKNENKDMVDGDSITIDPEKLHDPDLQEKVAKLNKKFKQRKSNVVDFNKFLEDNDRSHKDGLDLVPNDGYIAELHEGEMVVPEKPAGKLRGLMDKVGKGFKGLTDILGETSEDDVDHRDEEPGMVEESLLHGTIKGLRGIGGLMGGIASFMGNMGNFFSRGMSKEEERDREDNALGVTDDEADRLKEIEDRARYEHASRKNVDFVQEKIAAEDKEKEEKAWKEKMLAAVQNMGGFAASAGSSLFDLLKNGIDSLLGGFDNLGGLLGSLALPAGVAALMKMGDNYQKSEEYIQGRTDADGELVTDNYDLAKGRTLISARNQLFVKPAKAIKKRLIDPIVRVGKGVFDAGKKAFDGTTNLGKKVYNSKVGQKFLQPIGEKYNAKMTNIKEFVFGKKAASTADNVVDFASAKAAKTGSSSALKGSGKVINLADAKIAKGATETSSGKALSKMVSGAADEGGLINKLVKLGKQALAKIGEYATEKFPKIAGLADNLVKSADDIFVKLLKFADDILPSFAKKITALFTKIGVGAASGFTIDAVFAVGDLITGFTAGNAGNLFGVSTENVDARMRIISSVIQAVFNFNFMAIISLINEITNMMFNFNFLRNIAIWLYNLTGGKNDFSSRITSKEIDSCTSIEQALQIMGITDPNEIAMLRDGDDWKDFSKLDNKEFGGVISATEQMELARLQYNLANGTKLSSQAFIDKQSKTFGSKVMDWGKKLFKKETAQQKIHKLETKATSKRTKAEEYRKKSAESNNIFGKAWNNSMAWLNEKSAKKAEEKAAKKRAEAPEKQAKYQSKADYHTEKAANATGISKWYHNWRAKANTKKVDRYTLKDGQVINETELQGTANGTTDATEAKTLPPVLTPEQVLAYNDIPEGEFAYDGYGRAYDHNGNYVGDAGMGDGEEVLVPNATYTGEYKTSKKDDSKLKKAAKKGLLNTLFPTAGALYAGFKAGKKLFGKKEKPEDYQMVPVLDAEGNIISYTKQLIDETTEIKGYGEESLQVGEITKNTQVIPQMDEKGNVVSYTTIDKKSSKSKSWLSRLGSAVGSLFGIGGSSSSSSTVDNSSSVDNSVTGDTNTYNTYNGSTSEIDTSVFGSLTEAINNLIGSGGNNNIDEEGNVKTGGILKVIMDPMGYLTKKLTNYGIDVYESKTGKEADMEKVNRGVTIFNMLRDPFGYLSSIFMDQLDPNQDGKKDKTIKEAIKGTYDTTVDTVSAVYEDGKKWTVDKYNTAKNWTVDKYNTAKDWTVDKYNTAKDWTVDKYNKGKKWVNRQAEMSDDVADIMMGDNSANAGFLSTAITMGSKAPTALWNMLAPEEYKLSEEVIPNFVASMINDFIVTPFREFKGPIVEKFNETKEKVMGWVDEVKTSVMGWFKETIAEPFMKWHDERLEDMKWAKDKIVEWNTAIKDKVFGWFKDNVSEPFMKWHDERLEDMKKAKEAIIEWNTAIKDKVFDWFGENIKEPFMKWHDNRLQDMKKAKEAIIEWNVAIKDKVFEWFGENIKEPFMKWHDERLQAMKNFKDKAINWVKDTKEKVFDWFGENVKEPFTKWASEKKDKITEMYNSAKSWIGGVKDKVVESFNKYIKEPAEEALKPLTDGISRAWSSLKTAFSPLSELFSAVGSGDWGAVYNFITGKSKAAAEEVNASEDNDRFHGSTNTKPLDQQVKPKNYVFNETENTYTGKDAGRTDGGLKDKGNTHNFPFYAQADNRWGKDRIGNAYMSDSGCGPTATAMVMTHLTGQHITPDTMAKIGKEYLPGYTSYNYFPEVADKFNLNYAEANDAASIKARLMNGQPILLSGYDNSNGRMTPYTSKGHIVVATGIDGNNVQINDPRGPEYSGSYSLNNVVKGLKRGIVLSSTKDTKKVGLPTSGLYSNIHDMNGQYDYNGDLPTDDTMENLGGDVGQIKLWEKVVGYAKAFTEKLKYVYGSKAIDKNGMTTDCSGFTKHVMDRCGINIPAGSANQKNAGTGVDPSQAQAGDLVVWKGHVGLVIDSNKNMIDAGNGSVPKIRSYETDYWRSRGSYVIRRVIDPNKMVSAKVDNYHTGIGFSGVVGSQGGGDLNGGVTVGDGTTTTDATAVAAAPQVELLGPFAELEKIGNSMIGAAFNGKSYQKMYDSLYAQPVATTTTDGTTSGDSSNSGTVDIGGISDTATAVWKFFTGKGYNKYATAGIMGNLQQESGMDPTRKQSGGGPGRGIAQWTVSEGRFKGLQSHAQSKGKDWTDLQSQLEWIDMELGGKDSTTANILKKNYGGLSGLKNASSTKWAVEAFEKSFERAGKPMWEKRYNYADNYYNKFSSAGAGVEMDGNAGGGFTMATSAEAAPSSGIPTTMNGWAYYKQGDSKWQEDINGKKIGPSGCGMASHAMMLTTMFGKQVTPVTVGKWARKNGYWNNGMAWEMPAAVANKLGLSLTKSETNPSGLGASSLSNIKAQIKSGYPVVLSGKGKSSSYDTPFTDGGHIVLAVGVDGSGNLIINDPRDPKRTKAYSDNGVLNIGTGLRGYWAFDKPSSASLPEDWASGEYSGGNSGGTTTGGTTTGGTAAAPQVDLLGPFAELEKIGNSMLGAAFNGKSYQEMYDSLYAQPVATTTTDGTTSGGATNSGGTGSVQIDETLMYSGTDGFFKALSGAAMNTYNQYKNVFPSTILAQAACESAWGKSSVAKSDKNLFGIKWTGRHNPLITVEKGKNCPGGEQGGARPYNRYKSFGDSVLDHGWFLNTMSPYKATLAAKTPTDQIRKLGVSGYAEAGTYGNTLMSIYNKYDLNKYNPGNTAGAGDGNTYLVSPKGDAGQGDGSVVRTTYNKSIVNKVGDNKTNINSQREIENLNRKINVAVNNINTSDPNVYAEVLKLIVQELRAINSNTANTVNGIKEISIVSANEPVPTTGGNGLTTADTYQTSTVDQNVLRRINTSTGYNMARQIASYKQK